MVNKRGRDMGRVITDFEESMSRQEAFSQEAKSFFSVGSTFSILGCSTVVQIIWLCLADMWSFLSRDPFGLLISLSVVFLYAYCVPEPSGFPDSGKLRLTKEELFFGTINSFFVFAIAIGMLKTLSFT